MLRFLFGHECTGFRDRCAEVRKPPESLGKHHSIEISPDVVLPAPQNHPLEPIVIDRVRAELHDALDELLDARPRNRWHTVRSMLDTLRGD